MRWPTSVLVGITITVSAALATDPPKLNEIETDRPDVTPYTVPKGSLQLESGVAWTGDEISRALDLTESLLRIGMTDTTELRIGIPTYFRNLGRLTLGSGFNDTLIGVKQQLGELGGTDFAIVPALSIPTGSTTRSSHGYDPQLEMPWQRDLPHSFDISGVVGIFYLSDDGHRRIQGENQIELERRIGRRSDIFLEYQSFFGQGLADNSLQMGGGYKLKPNHRIDYFVVIGLSRAAPNVAVGVGYSFRLDKVFRN